MHNISQNDVIFHKIIAQCRTNSFTSLCGYLPDSHRILQYLQSCWKIAQFLDKMAYESVFYILSFLTKITLNFVLTFLLYRIYCTI